MVVAEELVVEMQVEQMQMLSCGSGRRGEVPQVEVGRQLGKCERRRVEEEEKIEEELEN